MMTNPSNPIYFEEFTSGKKIAKTTPFTSTISAVADERRQDQRAGSGSVIVDKRHTAGEPFTIDYGFNEGSVPEFRRLSSDANDAAFCIQGYYFQY
jgi:hypothetical protein